MPQPIRKPDVKTVPTLPLQPMPKRGPGRPARRAEIRPPQFQWQNDYEKELYESYIAEHLEDYPNLKKSDKKFLWLAAAQYVLCMRLVGEEASTGQLVTQARQHPGTMLVRYMDTILATTRKQRIAKKDDEDENDDLMKLLSPSAA